MLREATRYDTPQEAARTAALHDGALTMSKSMRRHVCHAHVQGRHVRPREQRWPRRPSSTAAGRGPRVPGSRQREAAREQVGREKQSAPQVERMGMPRLG